MRDRILMGMWWRSHNHQLLFPPGMGEVSDLLLKKFKVGDFCFPGVEIDPFSLQGWSKEVCPRLHTLHEV